MQHGAPCTSAARCRYLTAWHVWRAIRQTCCGTSGKALIPFNLLYKSAEINGRVPFTIIKRCSPLGIGRYKVPSLRQRHLIILQRNRESSQSELSAPRASFEIQVTPLTMINESIVDRWIYPQIFVLCLIRDLLLQSQSKANKQKEVRPQLQPMVLTQSITQVRQRPAVLWWSSCATDLSS